MQEGVSRAIRLIPQDNKDEIDHDYEKGSRLVTPLPLIINPVGAILSVNLIMHFGVHVHNGELRQSRLHWQNQ